MARDHADQPDHKASTHATSPREPGSRARNLEHAPESIRTPDALAAFQGDTPAVALASLAVLRAMFAEQSSAAAMAVLSVTAGGSDPTDPKALATWPAAPGDPSWLEPLRELIARAARERTLLEAPMSGGPDGTRLTAAIAPLTDPDDDAASEEPPSRALVAAVLLATDDPRQLAAARTELSRLRLAHRARAERQTATCLTDQLHATGDAVSVLAAFNTQTRLHAAAFALVNTLVRTLGADRVSLGLVARDRAHVLVISDVERVSHRQGDVRALAHAMEEAIDQHAPVAFPEQPEVPPAVSRSLRALTEQGPAHAIAVPLTRGDDPVGCIVAQNTAPWSERELATLRLVADLSGARLVELRNDDRWIGAKLAHEARRLGAAIVGPRHTLTKLVSALVAALLIASVLIHVPREATGSFVIEAERARILAAPFEGFIEEVHAGHGDELAQGDPVLSMRTIDLRLSLAAAERRVAVAEAEAAAARSEGRATEAELAEARAAEARASVRLARTRLEAARVSATIAGVLDAESLARREGAAVATGDALARVLDPASLIATLRVPERAAGELRADQPVALALASAPGETLAGRVINVSPVVEVQGGQNVALCRVFIENAPAELRAGQTGVARVRLGQGPALFVYTEPVVDWLRTQLFKLF